MHDMRFFCFWFLWHVLFCSILSHTFSDDPGLLFLPDLASEGQEAQVARLFLFPFWEALFSPDIPDSFFLFYFCCLAWSVFACNSVHCVLSLCFLVFLDEITQVAIQEQEQLQQQEEQHSVLGEGMVDAGLKPSPSTQVRLTSSFYFLSVLGRDLYLIYFPVPV